MCPIQSFIPQWSFALSNANFSAATVTMTSNGVPVAVTQQTYVTGYGENTLVWYPTALTQPISDHFPLAARTRSMPSPSATWWLPAGRTNSVTTSRYLTRPPPVRIIFRLAISGPNQPAVNASNPYSCTPATNPNTTSYQWVTAQATNGNLVDNALNGLTNFTISPAPDYPLITNSPVGAGKCFHLATSIRCRRCCN